MVLRPVRELDAVNVLYRIRDMHVRKEYVAQREQGCVLVNSNEPVILWDFPQVPDEALGSAKHSGLLAYVAIFEVLNEIDFIHDRDEAQQPHP